MGARAAKLARRDAIFATLFRAIAVADGRALSHVSSRKRLRERWHMSAPQPSCGQRIAVSLSGEWTGASGAGTGCATR